MKEDILLYSVYHKPAPIPTAKYVLPILVGDYKNLNDFPKGAVLDSTGDNISYLNKSFCELTALYWIWKNGDRAKHKAWGLCHYRRYFMKKNYRVTGTMRSRKYFDFKQQNIDKIVNDNLYKHISNMLDEYQIIIQLPVDAHKVKNKRYTIEEAYKLNHIASDWQKALEVVLEKYPSYSNSVETFRNSLSMSYYNMMIASWKVWDDYLEWLFNIFLDLKDRITVTDHPYQGRAFGFLSERLINLYIHHNKLKAGYTTIALFEE